MLREPSAVVVGAQASRSGPQDSFVGNGTGMDHASMDQIDLETSTVQDWRNRDILKLISGRQKKFAVTASILSFDDESGSFLIERVVEVLERFVRLSDPVNGQSPVAFRICVCPSHKLDFAPLPTRRRLTLNVGDSTEQLF